MQKRLKNSTIFVTKGAHGPQLACQGGHPQRQGSSHPAHDGKNGKGEKTERGGKSQLEALCRHAEFRGLQTHRRSRQKGQHDGGGMGGSHPDHTELPDVPALHHLRPLLPAASRGNKSWRAWHPADVPPACRLPPACCSAEGFPRRREHRSPLLCAESTFLLLAVLQKFYFR